MSGASIDRDERTVAVEGAAYRWSYLLLTYGLLALAAWRGLSRREPVGDLLALVIASGVVNAGYQFSQRVLFRRWAAQVVGALLLALVLAAVAMFLGRAR